MHLGEVIKDYRSKNDNMSLQAFADKANLSKGYIAMLERNVNPTTGEAIIPSVETFIKTAKAMNMSLENLLSIVDENQPISVEIGKTIAAAITPQKSTKATRIPVYGRVPAGIPIEAIEDIRDWEEIPASWVGITPD